MAGNVVGVAMVEALRASGSASDDADRSGSTRARAGGELEVRGQKHKKGQGARLDLSLIHISEPTRPY